MMSLKYQNERNNKKIPENLLLFFENFNLF